MEHNNGFIPAGTGPPPVESKIIAGRRYESPFSVEELLNLVLPKKQSKDVDMDPCKSPSFIGKSEEGLRLHLHWVTELSRRHRLSWGGKLHQEDKAEISWQFRCEGHLEWAQTGPRVRILSPPASDI